MVAPVFHDKKSSSYSVKERAELIAQYMKFRYAGNVYAICGFESSWEVVEQLLRQSKIVSQKIIVQTEGNIPGRFMEQMLKS